MSSPCGSATCSALLCLRMRRPALFCAGTLWVRCTFLRSRLGRGDGARAGSASVPSSRLRTRRMLMSDWLLMRGLCLLRSRGGTKPGLWLSAMLGKEMGWWHGWAPGRCWTQEGPAPPQVPPGPELS